MIVVPDPRLSLHERQVLLCVQVLCHCGKINLILPVLGIVGKLDVIAKSIGDRCGQRHGLTIAVANWHKEIDRQPVLMSTVRSEPTAGRPSSFTVDKCFCGMFRRQRGVRTNHRVGDHRMYMRASDGGGECAIGSEVWTTARKFNATFRSFELILSSTKNRLVALHLECENLRACGLLKAQ